MLQSQPSFPDWLTAIVAAAALVQPWLIALFRKVYRRPSIQIDLSGPVKLSFGLRGSGVDLQTSLRAVNGDIFVTGASVTLVNKRTSGKQVLQWAVTVAQTVDYQGRVQAEPVVATGFVIPERLGYSFRAEYYADNLSSGTRDVYQALDRAFSAFSPVYADEELLTIGDDQKRLATVRYEKFKSTSDLPVQVFNKLQSDFLLQHGDYLLTLELTTVDGAKFTATGEFTVTELEAEQLRANAATVVNRTVGVASLFYNASLSISRGQRST